MTTAISSITPQTAPRDIQGLMKSGIFQLRLLVEKLGFLQTEEQKTSFARLSHEQKAEHALRLLQEWDKVNPGAAAMPAPQQAPQMPAPQMPAMAAPPQMSVPVATVGAPASYANGTVNGVGATPAFQAPATGAAPMPFTTPMPPMQQMPIPQVQQVDPAALAQAQANAGATAPEGKTRKPRNSSSKENGESTDMGAQIVGLLTQFMKQSESNTETVVGALRQVNASLEELNKSDANSQLKSLSASYAGVYQVLSSWESRLAQIQMSTNVSITLSLILAEQVLGAGRGDVLQAALGDAPSIAQYISQVTSGAPGKG